jgi:gamma-glutamyltranspeptidase/glutathione hydrolase
VGHRGVVTAVAPTAAFLGAEALRAGGNAFDAGVVAALAETVLIPSKCGLAGDLVALVLPKEADAPESLISVGPAPAALAATIESSGLPLTGPLSVGVPGAPAGYEALARRGRFDLGQLAQPAIDLARDGFAWSWMTERLVELSRDLIESQNPEGTVYLPDEGPHKAGEIVTLPGLAKALEEFVTRGSGLFAGPLGEAAVAAITSRGGVMTLEDLGNARCDWSAPDRCEIEGRTLWTTPAPTQGAALRVALDGLKQTDSTGDVFSRVMAGKHWLSGSLADVPAGVEGTSIVTAADGEGNVVVIVHSNSFPRFGSGIVVHDYDLILNNRAGRGFSAEADHPNFPRAGQRPATTLHAWAVMAADGDALMGGTPGGENQMSWNAQTAAHALGGETDPGRLVAVPRWEWESGGEVLKVEEGFSADELADLSNRVQRLETVPALSLIVSEHVVRRRVGAAPTAAVDPRYGGAFVAV